MVIDTSAIFAAITGKPDSGVYRNAIIAAPLRLISAVTLLETQIVLVSRSGSNSIPILHELIERAGIVVVPFDEPIRAITAGSRVKNSKAILRTSWDH